MALSDAQLLLLNNLIYTDYVADGKQVKDIIDKMEENHFKIKSCEMTTDEWKEIAETIKADEKLMEYTVTNYRSGSGDDNGMRVACFVDDEKNPQDINVVFRGTGNANEWRDNGEGGYVIETQQQVAARDYINGLPEEYGNNLTVSGHSKGGNKAQYVTITTDKIGRCVSFDGQGFSEEFLNEYADEIAARRNKITSISAEKDVVNALLYPIAGTQIFIETPEQKNTLLYHKPNILIDKNGNFGKRTEPSEMSVLINEFSTYLISNMEEPARSYTINNLIAVVVYIIHDEKEDNFAIKTALSLSIAAGHIDDSFFNIIEKVLGKTAKDTSVYLLSVVYPALFVDDLIPGIDKHRDEIVIKLVAFSRIIQRELEVLDEKAIRFSKFFVAAVNNFVGNVRAVFDKGIYVGNSSALANSYIRIDTGRMRWYADRLNRVNSRIAALDRRLDKLYRKVGLADLFALVQADAMTRYDWRLKKCVNYLYDTAYDFERADNSIASQLY